MYNKLIKDINPLGFQWETKNPFIFCVHHLDEYPAGNDELGPADSLSGRHLGQDFTKKDGWRMYHGEKVPGFPAHPHRGFETITIVLDGFVDHSDSHGAQGRYGNGDVQWMTAGKGLQHAEMFPLLNPDKGNRLELFQIWLNLPAKKKFVEPHYKMLWDEEIPIVREEDKSGNKTEVRIIAGKLKGISAPPPAPDSWAADEDNNVAIWLIKMQPNAKWTIPQSSPFLNRALYFYKGKKIEIGGLDINPYNAVELMPEFDLEIQNGDEEAFLLFMQAKPIDESVVQHGPFVMNSREEIQKAFSDYRETQFGGWPWDEFDNVHPREAGRFAKYNDGSEEFK
jgi:redox-sensitive bicupin YhaK (pirin superfamily)